MNLRDFWYERYTELQEISKQQAEQIGYWKEKATILMERNEELQQELSYYKPKEYFNEVYGEYK